MPKMKKWPAPLALLAMPYVLAYVLVMLLVLTIGLVIMLIWLAAKLILALPRMLLMSVSSKGSLVEGAHRELAADDEMFGSAQADDDRQRELQALGLADPGRAAALTATAGSLWAAWQQALASGDVDRIRPAMTEGYWRLNRLLVQSRAKDGVERVFDARVTGAEVESAHHRRGADEVGLRLSCTGTCFDRADGHVLRGTTSSATWVEHITLRRSEAGAGPDSQVLPVTCPNCGAPLQVGPDGQCTTCGTLAAARAGDWALANAWRSSW